jgi:toxin-antitoxin system PIN domain toxin
VTALLDVNVLIALVDTAHVQHDAAHGWFARHIQKEGWATCPLTENGMVRVLSQPAYPSGPCMPSEVIEILRALKDSHRQVHEFWTDDVSLSDESLFQPPYIIGPRSLTDAYLLGLAARRGGKLVSFDRSLPWQTIRGGTSGLVESPV